MKRGYQCLKIGLARLFKSKPNGLVGTGHDHWNWWFDHYGPLVLTSFKNWKAFISLFITSLSAQSNCRSDSFWTKPSTLAVWPLVRFSFHIYCSMHGLTESLYLDQPFCTSGARHDVIQITWLVGVGLTIDVRCAIFIYLVLTTQVCGNCHHLSTRRPWRYLGGPSL